MNTIRLWRARFESRARKTHGQIPGIKRLPLPALGIILLLALVNLLSWAAVGAVLVGVLLRLRVIFGNMMS